MGLFDRFKPAGPLSRGVAGKADDSGLDAARLLEEGVALEQQGRLDEALLRYEAAVRVAPDLARAHFLRGNILLEKGDAEAAKAAYATALMYKPDSAAAHYNMGNACALLGQHDAAVNSCRQALALKPDFVDAEVALGAALEELGQLEAAVASYQRALLIKPDYTEVHYNLANALKLLGRTDEAAASYLQAAAVGPRDLEGLKNTGQTLMDLGRPEAAVTAYRMALEIFPADADVHNYLGAALKKQGRLEEALMAFRQALEICPNAVGHNNIGAALRSLGRLDDAAESYRQALIIRPDFVEAHHNLGNVLAALSRNDDALASYRRALEINPDFAETLCCMGVLLLDIGQFHEAMDSYQRALALKPDYAYAHNNLGNVLQFFGQFERALKSTRRALEISPDFIDAHDSLLFMYNYLGEQPASVMLDAARRYGEVVARQVFPNVAGGIRHDRDPDPERVLRVGLVSGDLCYHPVGFFAEGVVSALASRADRLELFAYPTCIRTDEISERIKANCRGWHPVAGLSDEYMANRIRADGIDILIDLSGHTAYNRLPVFAWKPAPVQVSWLGYFATTGVAAIDYFVADPWTLPESEEINFTEKVWRLPETRLCFTPPDAAVAVSTLPALVNGYVTFGCFNNLSKMNDKVVALWARVMEAVPGSRLFLKARQLTEASVRKSIAERFAAHGIDEGRLILEDYVPRENYLAAYQRVDLALDPFPYTGGTTTAEALWMAVPVLTLAGERFISRQGVGLLMNAGLPDWIASDPDDYVARALAHASDLPRLAALRGNLRAQVLASPVYDAARFAKHFETALRGMWQQWCSEQASATDAH
jgi:predicted O-linked N-acetylglucosamine transferase (SPINDLY family)